MINQLQIWIALHNLWDILWRISEQHEKVEAGYLFFRNF